MINTFFKPLLIAFILSLNSSSQAQKATISVMLNDSSDENASRWEFAVKIKNNKIKKYLVQDTTFIKERLGAPHNNSLTPYLAKQQGNKYVEYNPIRRPGIAVPVLDTCLWKCCNCLVLKKGEQLTLELDILRPFKLEKGRYRLQVALIPPIVDCKDCKYHTEIHSDYIYFEVK